MGFQILLSSGEMNRSSVEQVLSVNEDDIGVFAEAVEKDLLAIRRNVEAADGITGPEFSELTKTARSEIAEPKVLFTERTLK